MKRGEKRGRTGEGEGKGKGKGRGRRGRRGIRKGKEGDQEGEIIAPLAVENERGRGENYNASYNSHLQFVHAVFYLTISNEKW